jgi:tetratricopeptide (TPR) repeat protein
VKSAAIAGLLLVALARQSALADPPEQDTAYREGRAHVEAGDRAFDAGDYGRAADEYLAAYQRIPLPDLLYNLGQCYRLAGDGARAIEYYRRYLAVAPSGAAADKAREHIARLGGKPDEPGGGSGPAKTAAPAPPPIVTAPAPSPAPVDRGAPRARWLALGLAGTGLLAAAGGAVLWISADRTHARLERDCAPGCDESDWTGARTRERAGIVLGAAGLTAVAGGLLWWGWSGSF